jgi:hypothetical protein
MAAGALPKYLPEESWLSRPRQPGLTTTYPAARARSALLTIPPMPPLPAPAGGAPVMPAGGVPPLGGPPAAPAAPVGPAALLVLSPLVLADDM